jgi:hypothetical protein
MLAFMLIKDHYKGRVKEQKENTYKNVLKKTHEKNIYTPSEQYPNSPRPFLIVRCTRNHTIILINLEKRIYSWVFQLWSSLKNSFVHVFSKTKACFICRISVASNAIQTIDEMINLIKLHYLLFELSCIRRDRNSTYKTALNKPKFALEAIYYYILLNNDIISFLYSCLYIVPITH